MAQSDRDTWQATVRSVDDGFFIGDAESSAQMGGRFSTLVVNGIPSPTQFFRVKVDVEDHSASSHEIWVVISATATLNRKPPPDLRLRDDTKLHAVRPPLLAAFPDATMCFTTEDREGFSGVIGEPEHAISIAAAVSVVKYFAAWDESDPITVEIAGAQFAVSVAYTDRIYRAVVRRGHPNPRATS